MLDISTLDSTYNHKNRKFFQLVLSLLNRDFAKRTRHFIGLGSTSKCIPVGRPLFLHSFIPSFLYSAVPIFLNYSVIPLFRYSSIPLFPYSPIFLSFNSFVTLFSHSSKVEISLNLFLQR